MSDKERGLWPSVWEVWPPVHDDHTVGEQLFVAGRLYHMDVAYGPDRPANCQDRHPLNDQQSRYEYVCACTPGHDGPHITTTTDYMQKQQFTITGLQTLTGGKRL